MKTDDLDYTLPQELIAQEGLPQRAASRLLVLNRSDDTIQHRRFDDLIRYLHPGDCLVVNDSKVIPARFWIRRETGGRIEGLFLREEKGLWEVLLKGAARLKENERVRLDSASGQSGPQLMALERLGRGQWRMQLQEGHETLNVLEQFGATPLPPYIRRNEGEHTEDRGRYQTVYATAPGSIAAPTAGLHFTRELLAQVDAKGVELARVTLHVGLGTFLPVTAEAMENHEMHSEWYRLTHPEAERINTAIERGSRVIAVGTTSVRVLETLGKNGRVTAGTGQTRLMILPGYEWQLVGAMVTNFHLPRTTLLALVCAFGGTLPVLAAYREAVQKRYRFYSYGDAMLIL